MRDRFPPRRGRRSRPEKEKMLLSAGKQRQEKGHITGSQSERIGMMYYTLQVQHVPPMYRELTIVYCDSPPILPLLSLANRQPLPSPLCNHQEKYRPKGTLPAPWGLPGSAIHPRRGNCRAREKLLYREKKPPPRLQMKCPVSSCTSCNQHFRN